MTPPLFSTAYLPPISYFVLLAKEEHIVIEQFETFPKQTYRNRTVILTANGPLSLSIPVVRTKGNHTMTCDIEVSYAENWPIKHWRAIESAYNASPYFLYYKDGLQKIILTPQKSLLQLNKNLLEYLLKKTKITTQVSYSMDYTKEGTVERDYRNTFSPKVPTRGIILPEYDQVFESKMPFHADMSILDLLFNLGPDTKSYLLNVSRETTMER